ncbi:hypothetical protein ACQJBY_044705 [Aegilops geniculata]
MEVILSRSILWKNYEELGLEYDEDVDVNFQPYSEMLASLNKRREVSR